MIHTRRSLSSISASRFRALSGRAGLVLHLSLALVLVLLGGLRSTAQDFLAVEDQPVSPEVERMYLRGLEYLMSQQNDQGMWPDGQGQAGVIGLALLAILAHGDDPNVGPYAPTVRKAVDALLKQRNADTGYIGNSMYNHGFGTLALAEAYGAVNDDRLGPALKQAVELTLSSQSKNPMGAWRYNPQSNDADTTVSGAVLVSLFAARNAGVDVPEASITKALEFYKACQGSDGGFGYTSPGGSNQPRNAIGTLVLALAKKRDSRMYERAFAALKNSPDENNDYHHYYYLYYGAQAFFHSDPQGWREWNAANIKELSDSQNENGSWTGSQGVTFSTATALLSLAVNYRFLPIYER